MKKSIIVSFLALALIVGGAYALTIKGTSQEIDNIQYEVEEEMLRGGGQEARFNKIDSLTSTATSTGTGAGGSENPVLVLAIDVDRRYLECVNNTATDLWLFATSTTLDLTGTGAANNASTSISSLNGILLEAKKAGAPVAKWIVEPDNMVYGNIYASTTAADIEIICNYK